MSIAAVVTRGYSFGTIADVATRGYIPGVAPPTPTPTVGGFAKKYRYRVRLEDGTYLYADTRAEAINLRREYEPQLAKPEIVVRKARTPVKIERVEAPLPKVYAQPIRDALSIDLKGDANAHLAKLAMELDDDEEAIQIALDLLI